MKKILFFLLLAVCSMSISAQVPSKKCPVCGLSIPKCQYKGKHPKEKPSQTNPGPKPAKHSSTPQKGKQPEKPTKGTLNGHDWVELGLSVKWATCNIGAFSPDEYGDYYAWGETRTKMNYYLNNCETREKTISDIAGNSTYDVARVTWGDKWCLPTKEECEELVDKCDWIEDRKNGHKGYRVVSKINGNSIYLPLAGWGCSSIVERSESGHYWSSTPGNSTKEAYSLNFGKWSPGVTRLDRANGFSIRPVIRVPVTPYSEVINGKETVK